MAEVHDGAGRVRAAGCALWRRDATGVLQVACIHRARYDDWTLPKGHVEGGEHELVAAVREVREETGYDAVPGRPLGTSDYTARGEPKRVRWWAARAVAAVGEPDDEVDALVWCDTPGALDRLTLPSDRALVQRLAGLPVDTVPVVLVRHAHAGSRSAFDGDDDIRPLSPKGYVQADALVAPLALLRPETIVSAPPLRCLDTVAPLAERLEVTVQPDPRLSEETNPAVEVGAALDAVLEAVRRGRPAVLCSQGRVLPGLLRRLLAAHDVRPAARLGVPVGKPRKGSVTVLHVCDGHVLVAEHHASLAPLG